jgi:hypothetical protein
MAKETVVDALAGPVGDDAGSTLEALPDGQESQPCSHHRLHLPFLRCHQRADYLLTKGHGERVALCRGHAAELKARFDVPAGEPPRLADGLDLDWRNPFTDSQAPASIGLPDAGDDAAPADTTFEDTALAGGESGGGGAGACWAPADTGDDLNGTEAPQADMEAAATSEPAAADESAPEADSPPEEATAGDATDSGDTADSGGGDNG